VQQVRLALQVRLARKAFKDPLVRLARKAFKDPLVRLARKAFKDPLAPALLIHGVRLVPAG
jgi:hypothetical protein